MAEKIKVEKMTTEKTFCKSNYFKGGLLLEDFDEKKSLRIYGVKKLSAYSSQIEKLIQNNPKIEIEENYFRNGEKFEIIAKTYTDFVRISNMEVKKAEIEIEENYTDGKVIITSEKRIYNIELY